MTIITIADLTASGAKVQISSTSVKVRWVKACVLGSSVTARFGDTNVSTGRGLAIPSGLAAITVVEPVAQDFEPYDLSEMFAYLPSGATLTITAGVD
jgi:hypothetical protein